MGSGTGGLSGPVRADDVMTGLIADEPRVALDIGCGTGFVACPLAPRVDRLDAIDMPPSMIEEGKPLPGGDDSRLRWMVGKIEDAPLDPPYPLVAARDSLLWMDWDMVLPGLADALTPSGLFANVYVSYRLPAGLDAFEEGRRARRERYIRTPTVPRNSPCG